jgi:hypothetical protein
MYKIKLKFPKKISQKNIYDYFKGHNLNLNDKRYKSKGLINPDLDDLYFLHNFIILNKRLNILEIGTGWSSLVILNAHSFLLKKYSKQILSNKYINTNFTILDNNKKFLKLSRNRNKYIKNKFVKYQYSKVVMTEFNGRYCTQFVNFPKINPEFIYLDGPSQYGVLENKNFSFNTDADTLMPMISDILKIEFFLSPGTVIISDGRKANINFLFKNFQRNWKLKSDESRSILVLCDEPLGLKNKKKLEFYNCV